MRLAEYLHKDLILSDMKATAKVEALTELVAAVGAARPGFDARAALDVLRDRESLGTTGIGDGIAIPHGKLKGLDSILVVVGRSVQGVDFDALDHRPCHVFFLVLAPEDAMGQHLRLLAHISRILKDEQFRRDFRDAQSAESFRKILKDI